MWINKHQNPVMIKWPFWDGQMIHWVHLESGKMCHFIHETWDILLSGIHFHVSDDQCILKYADLSITPDNPSIWLNCTFYDDSKLSELFETYSEIMRQQQHRDHSSNNRTSDQATRSSPAQQQHTTAKAGTEWTAVESCSCFWTGEQSWYIIRNINLPHL